jgi:cytochrome bd-type quinol oxidase subunit 2
MTIVLRDFDSFKRVTSWEEWLDVTKATFPEYFPNWAVSNFVGLLLLAISFYMPSFSRKTWGLLMVLASLVNIYMMVTDPTCYIEFGVLAVPPMQRFIYSRYYARPELIVLPIAFCQFLIGIELFFDGKSHRLRKIALASAITFFIGLVFLGVGSAFPSSVLYALTMAKCWPELQKSKTI